MNQPSKSSQPAIFADDGPRLILAIASHQRTANLALLLELARPDSDDAIVWAVSDLAERRDWTGGPTKVLERHDRKVLKPLRFPDQPTRIFEVIEREIAKRKTRFAKFAHFCLIMNGGTKTMPVQFDMALRDVFPDKPIIAASNEAQSPIANIWPTGWAEGTTLPFSQAITLEDILECNGYRRTKVAGRLTGIKLWPAGTLPEAKDPSSARYAGYQGNGKEFNEPDWAFIDESHRAVRVDRLPDANITWPDWNDLPHDQRGKLIRFMNLELNLALGLESDLPARTFRAFRNRVAEWFEQKRKNEWFETSDHTSSLDFSPGMAFELLVARRVKEWLDRFGHQYSICEAWAGAGIERVDGAGLPGERDNTDLDIAIVAANGTIFNLECKTNTADDLPEDIARKFQREADYANIGSQMGACFPVLSNFADSGWMGRIMKTRAAIDRRVARIDLTRPGQPTSFTASSSIGKYYVTAEGQVELLGARPGSGGPPVVPFEDALGKWLVNYRRSEAAVASPVDPDKLSLLFKGHAKVKAGPGG